MEHAAGALCVVLAQCRQVHSALSGVMRSRCEFTRLPVYCCLEEQQEKGSSVTFGECECNGCAVW